MTSSLLGVIRVSFPRPGADFQPHFPVLLPNLSPSVSAKLHYWPLQHTLWFPNSEPSLTRSCFIWSIIYPTTSFFSCWNPAHISSLLSCMSSVSIQIYVLASLSGSRRPVFTHNTDHSHHRFLLNCKLFDSKDILLLLLGPHPKVYQ